MDVRLTLPRTGRRRRSSSPLCSLGFSIGMSSRSVSSPGHSSTLHSTSTPTSNGFIHSGRSRSGRANGSMRVAEEGLPSHSPVVKKNIVKTYEFNVDLSELPSGSMLEVDGGTSGDGDLSKRTGEGLTLPGDAAYHLHCYDDMQYSDKFDERLSRGYSPHSYLSTDLDSGLNMSDASFSLEHSPQGSTRGSLRPRKPVNAWGAETADRESSRTVGRSSCSPLRSDGSHSPGRNDFGAGHQQNCNDQEDHIPQRSHGVKQMIKLFEKRPHSGSGDGHSSDKDTPKKTQSILRTPRRRSDAPTSSRRQVHRDGSPSYLHLSCSASGYGSYSSYSSQKRTPSMSASPKSSVSSTDMANKLDSLVVINGATATSGTVEDNSGASNTEVLPSRLGLEAEDPGNRNIVCNHSQAVSELSNVSNGVEILGGKSNIKSGDSSCDGDGCPARETDCSQKDDKNAFVTSTNDNIQCEGNTDSTQVPANNGANTPITEAAQLNPNKQERSTAKDGASFLVKTAAVEVELKELCKSSQEDLASGDLSEEVSGILRAAIGKANLLISKKFKQFRGLCDKNMTQTSDEEFPATEEDLAGFWDMVEIQISEIRLCFTDIDNLKAKNWKLEEKKKSAPRRNSKTLTGHTENTKAPAKTSKSEKETARQKAREEARKRLLAAKKAMRQRRESAKEEEEVIFISK